MISEISHKGPTILITAGDPAGIGPEIILRSLKGFNNLHRFIIFGDYPVMARACSLTGFPGHKLLWNQMKRNHVTVTGSQMNVPFHPGQAGRVNPLFGRYSYTWIKECVEFSHGSKNKKSLAIVTAPINKEASHKGGFSFSGHTDYLSYLYHAPATSMMFFSKRLKVILATIHCSLKQAITALSRKLILEKIEHAHYAMRRWGVSHPDILVCGLNPHAGEAGAFGDEEKTVILPAINAARRKNITVSGPFPPDTVFLKALDKKSCCVVAMYHDQALIPFKLLSFSTGVNVTIGLPVIRTSPDHGTAYDIAWKGNADESSFREAVRLALSMTS
jgi:4-phospho-D-threonate 3-dehydrogenase / 4-phospho-D-erythronate 3-dehydrogenase